VVQWRERADGAPTPSGAATALCGDRCYRRGLARRRATANSGASSMAKGIPSTQCVHSEIPRGIALQCLLLFWTDGGDVCSWRVAVQERVLLARMDPCTGTGIDRRVPVLFCGDRTAVDVVLQPLLFSKVRRCSWITERAQSSGMEWCVMGFVKKDSFEWEHYAGTAVAVRSRRLLLEPLPHPRTGSTTVVLLPYPACLCVVLLLCRYCCCCVLQKWTRLLRRCFSAAGRLRHRELLLLLLRPLHLSVSRPMMMIVVY
jgi:hypothetical protein